MSTLTVQERLAQLQRDLRQELSSSGELAGDLFRRAGKLVVEELLNAEVSEALGREPSQRREAEQSGYRNGYKSRGLKCGEGKIDIELPQVRDFVKDSQEQAYRSSIWQALSGRSPALDRMIVEMYARGLSTRDIEDLLKELSADGQEPLLSKSSVSEITEVLWEEFEAFSKRDLAGFDVVYLFCDAVYESLRQQASVKEAILVTWGILADGSKVLIHISQGNKESQEAWLEHFRSVVARNLPSPLTVTSDGAPGCIKAIEAMWPEAERIRCWVHKMKNILEKFPAEMHETIKSLLVDVRDAPDYESGKKRVQQMILKYQRQFPSAMSCLEDDLEASLAHLKLPASHRKTVRTTNLCERSFVEQRRRAKVLPRFRGERECLKLVFASLWRASERWRKVKFTPLAKGQLEQYIKARQAAGKKVRDLFVAA
jgi:transposase-like protein